MSAILEKTVRELALEIPAATRVFEKLHIDYCCGGNRRLEEACRVAGVPAEQVLACLETGYGTPAAEDWTEAALADLVDHIRNTHHAYTREALARITQLLGKVRAAHGANHPELAEIERTFDGLAQELTTHLMKEEAVLFPYIVRMEEAALANEPVLPSPFGSVRNPVRMMMSEHDSAGDALGEIRAASGGYTTPADGCASYHALYGAMAEFEADLHQHIHLENNILFPRALVMEG